MVVSKATTLIAFLSLCSSPTWAQNVVTEVVTTMPPNNMSTITVAEYSQTYLFVNSRIVDPGRSQLIITYTAPAAPLSLGVYSVGSGVYQPVSTLTAEWSSRQSAIASPGGLAGGGAGESTGLASPLPSATGLGLGPLTNAPLSTPPFARSSTSVNSARASKAATSALDGNAGAAPPGSIPPSVSQTASSPSSTNAAAPASSPKKSNAGAIAGGVIGGLAGLILILALIFFICARRRKQRKAAQMIPTKAAVYGVAEHGHSNPDVYQTSTYQYPKASGQPPIESTSQIGAATYPLPASTESHRSTPPAILAPVPRRPQSEEVHMPMSREINSDGVSLRSNSPDLNDPQARHSFEGPAQESTSVPRLPLNNRGGANGPAL